MTGPANFVTESVTSLAFKPLQALADETRATAEAVRAAAGELPEPATLGTHVPVQRWFAAWEALERERPDVAVPILAAQRSHLADLEVFGFLAMTAKSLKDALARIGRVRSLWARGCEWRLHEVNGVAELRLLSWSPQSRGAAIARVYLLAEMVQSMREIVGQRIEPLTVCVSAAPPVDEHPYRAFFGCEVRFGSTVDSLTFDRGIGELPVKVFDSRLHEFFQRECELLVKRAGDDDWLSQVRQWIAETYADRPPTAKELAKAMAISQRTLRRRLEASGTSFKRVQEDVGLELANAYLQRPGLTASEVAFLVGFSEPSAFFRAYRRWSGETPKSFLARTTP